MEDKELDLDPCLNPGSGEGTNRESRLAIHGNAAAGEPS